MDEDVSSNSAMVSELQDDVVQYLDSAVPDTTPVRTPSNIVQTVCHNTDIRTWYVGTMGRAPVILEYLRQLS